MFLFLYNINPNLTGAVMPPLPLPESETFETISKALNVVKTWKVNFQPLYCMTDYCNEEIGALESVFIGMYLFYLYISCICIIFHAT